MKAWIHKYRFELLVFALSMVIFNKIFVSDNTFYASVIWPLNMVMLGLVSLGIFHERKKWEILIRNILFFFVVAVPLVPTLFFQTATLTLAALLAYIIFYTFLFYSVMLQISLRQEVSASIVFGSLGGFLLIIVISTFSFLLLDFSIPDSFNNISGSTITEKYQQFSYFSLVTITTIGYGDITPLSDQARLLTGFWGVISQFYMVAIVGIIISKFTSK